MPTFRDQADEQETAGNTERKWPRCGRKAGICGVPEAKESFPRRRESSTLSGAAGK